MKYDSPDEYIKNFSDKVRTIAGRASAQVELSEDLARFEKVRPTIQKSVEKRDAELAVARATIASIIGDSSSYRLNFVVKILKPSASQAIADLEAEITKLNARTARLFGKEEPVAICYGRIRQLIDAIRRVRLMIEHNEKRHIEAAIIRKEERATKRLAKEAERAAMLEPFKKRIELGEAALGKTRVLASNRKRDLSRDHPCPYCGKGLGRSPVADHIWPVSRGGLSTTDNLVYVCSPCNQKKRDYSLTEFISRHNLNANDIHARLMKQAKRF